MSIIDHLKWRYATKKFDSTKKIAPDKLEQLLDAVRLSPSSYGLQSYKILVIGDAAVKQQLRAAAYGQEQLTEASHIIIFASETRIDEAFVKKYIDLIAQTRGVERNNLEPFEKVMIGTVDRLAQDEKITWSHKQVYLALGILLAAAAELGIDSCPMEGFDAGKFDEILGLTDKGLTASVMATIGYRSGDDTYSRFAKVRKSKEELFIRI